MDAMSLPVKPKAVTKPVDVSMGVTKVFAQHESLHITTLRAHRAAVRAYKAREARIAARKAAKPPRPVVQAPQGNPQQIAASMLGSYGWSSGEFSCLQPLWNAESGWNIYARNAGSGAYGIPQALPGSKMASAGPDWASDAATQIRWGLGYIRSVYGTPCGAWAHEQADGWY
jgi:hypothetical protein